MSNRIKTAALLCLTMLLASSVFASIPRDTFRPEQMLSGIQTHQKKTDLPSENRVGDFQVEVIIGAGFLPMQDPETHQVKMVPAVRCASGRLYFISADPLGIDGGVNVYMWANLNPLFFVDPYGLKTIVSHGVSIGSLMDDMASDLDADVFEWDTSASEFFGIPATVGEHFHSGAVADDFAAFIKQVAAENPGEPIDLVLYSGSGQIGVNAAELLADSGVQIQNMILLGAPVDEWKIDNVQHVYNFTSIWDPLSWNININSDNPVEYEYFNSVLHLWTMESGQAWFNNQGVRDAIKKILK